MRTRRERGAIAVIVAITVPTIIIIAGGMMLVGRILTTRQRLQYAADAVAMQGALVAKRQGLASGTIPNSQIDASWLPTMTNMERTLTGVRDGNLALVGAQRWPNWSFEGGGNDEWARSQIRLATQVAGYNLTADAAMRVRQLRTTTPRRRPPTLVLVLDYSNSMNRRSPSFGVAIQQLRAVVRRFLDILPQDEILIGAVIYGGGVYQTVEPASRRNSGDFSAIRQTLALAASGDTNTGAGIDEAVNMMLRQPENFGRNILLVSDGEPCCGTDSDQVALAAAARARATETQVITIEVHHVASGGHMHDMLLAMSGDAALHFEAESAEVLNQEFQGVRARPLCDITVPGVSDASDAFPYLRSDAGNERPLRQYTDPADMSCPRNCNVYGYRIDGPRVIMSPIACEDVFGMRRTALVRWGGTVLTL